MVIVFCDSALSCRIIFLPNKCLGHVFTASLWSDMGGRQGKLPITAAQVSVELIALDSDCQVVVMYLVVGGEPHIGYQTEAWCVSLRLHTSFWMTVPTDSFSPERQGQLDKQSCMFIL